jgi:hypothetical protein
MNDPTFLFYIAFLIVVVIFGLVVNPRLDRNRIRENIEEHGGKVIEIDRVWGWGTRNDRAYEVSYVTARGKRVNATCRTNIWRGVYWVNDRPPGLLAEESETGVSSMSIAADEPSGPAEQIQCLGCGAMVPANKVRCPQCGWSYKD